MECPVSHRTWFPPLFHRQKHFCLHFVDIKCIYLMDLHPGQLVESGSLYPETDCLIKDLLKLENIPFAMILYCSLDNSLIFLPEGHIWKSQMVRMLQQNCLCSLSQPLSLASNTSFLFRENIYAHLFGIIQDISFGPQARRWWKYKSYYLSQI